MRIQAEVHTVDLGSTINTELLQACQALQATGTELLRQYGNPSKLELDYWDTGDWRRVRVPEAAPTFLAQRDQAGAYHIAAMLPVASGTQGGTERTLYGANFRLDPEGGISVSAPLTAAALALRTEQVPSLSKEALEPGVALAGLAAALGRVQGEQHIWTAIQDW